MIRAKMFAGGEKMKATEIGQRLRKLREDRGQTMTFVARQLGISYSTLCAYEYGIHVPRDKVKVKIANYYGVTVGELFYAN